MSSIFHIFILLQNCVLIITLQVTFMIQINKLKSRNLIKDINYQYNPTKLLTDFYTG